MERDACRLQFEDCCCLDNVQFSESQAYLHTCVSDDFQDAGRQVDGLATDVDDQLPELQESIETAQTRTNKRYNLRKSLAWDAAFFTSEGVLDSEELSSMITGADICEKHWLPGIQEDISDSIESLSTLGSDNLNIETLEEDLFIDIRASIKRSSKKMSNMTNSSNKKPDIEVESVSTLSLGEEDITPQNKNPKPGPRKTNGQQTKSLPNHVGKQGSMKTVKLDSGHSQMNSVARIGDKIPITTNKSKTTSKSISTTITAKTESVTSLGKFEQGISKHAATSSKGTQPPNVSDGPTGAFPRTTVSFKPSLLGSSANGRVQPAMSSSSGEHSRMSSGIHAISKQMMAKRNLRKSSIEGTGSSGSTPKTPSRASQRNKPPPPTLSTHAMSNKFSSSVSPASSISESSSVSSSSSSSAVNSRFTNSKTSLDTGSCGSIDGDINLLHERNPLAEQSANNDTHKNQGVNLPSSNSKTSTTNGVVLASIIPSGLRKPSPKIGFFDGMKSSPHNPNGNQPSELAIPTIVPKKGTALGSSIRSSKGMLKCARATTTRLATSSAVTKQDSPQVAPAKSFQ